MTLAGRIVVMRSGEIEQVGSPMDIYLDPKSLFVADFFGSPSMNLVSGRVTSAGAGEVIETALFSVPAGARLGGHRGDRLTVGVRPEKVRLEPAGNGRGAGLPIALIEPLGRDTLVYLRTQGDKPFVAVMSGMSTGHLKAGQRSSRSSIRPTSTCSPATAGASPRACRRCRRHRAARGPAGARPVRRWSRNAAAAVYAGRDISNPGGANEP